MSDYSEAVGSQVIVMTKAMVYHGELTAADADGLVVRIDTKTAATSYTVPAAKVLKVTVVGRMPLYR